MQLLLSELLQQRGGQYILAFYEHLNELNSRFCQAGVFQILK